MMTGFCGWIDLAGATPTPRDAIHAMTTSLALATDAATLLDQHDLALATAGSAVTSAKETDGVAVLVGRPRFAVQPWIDQARQDGMARTLLAGYRALGPGVLAQLRGQFALALALPRERRLLIASDRLAICPLSYAEVNGTFVFATRADAVCRHPAVSDEVDLRALYDYLYFHFVPAPRTAYRRVTRLLPAHYVEVADGRARMESYWRVRYSRETERLSVDDLRAEFRELLLRGVREEADGTKVGSFLSGGTDSSTVTGLLGQHLQEPPRSYSIGFDASGFDETHYARLAAKHFGAQHHEYYVTPQDVVDSIPRIAAYYDAPFGNSSAVPVFQCAALAQRDGITRLLAGDGGDELFGGNTRYAKQYLFSLYHDIPAPLRRYLIEPVANAVRVPPVTKLRSYIQQASIPLPARLETYNLLERLGVDTVLEREFLAQADQREPLALLDDVYRSADARTTLNRILAIDLKFTLADNDLPKVSGMCAVAGVEVGYPMLNEELVEFAARLPVKLKLRGTRLRYFFKEALKDLLPAEIITKRKHGFGLPFGSWLVTHAPLHEFARASLQGLAQRGIVRPAFIDMLFTQRLREHPDYYGTMVWILMMLEQWFVHHRPATRDV
jgi:asparagine synthase (glutamine-hydrolysing)